MHLLCRSPHHEKSAASENRSGLHSGRMHFCLSSGTPPVPSTSFSPLSPPLSFPQHHPVLASLPGPSGASIPPRAPPTVHPPAFSWFPSMIDSASNPPLMMSAVPAFTLVSGPEPTTDSGTCTIDTGIERSETRQSVCWIEFWGPSSSKKSKKKGYGKRSSQEATYVLPVASRNVVAVSLTLHFMLRCLPLH